MTEKETLGKPEITETGPRPLTASQIEINTNRLRTGKIVKDEMSQSTFTSSGFFLVKDFMSRNDWLVDAERYWAPELLAFDPQQYSVRTTKFGNLGVYKNREGEFVSAQQKPKIIIEARDVRIVDNGLSIIGEVRPSGFVFPNPKYISSYRLGNDQDISPEQLEQMLLEAEKNSKSESAYNPNGGFAKVDPSFVNKDVLLFPFVAQYGNPKDAMQRDAVVIDIEERKLLPRVFYTLKPENQRNK
jgi:hypothetical protein